MRCSERPWALACVVVWALLSAPASSADPDADPDADPAINTTCSYSQVVAAMNDQSPGAAEQFHATPSEQSWLQNFLAAPPPQRRELVDQAQTQAQTTPEAASYVALFGPLGDACENY